MTLMAQAQHFAGPPHWTWYIVPYFFLAGLSGGCYALATLLCLRGERWDEPAARPRDGTLGKLWILVGALLGTFIAGYTGVLLAVSNQPVWSDTWTLGGLFLA